MKENRQYSEMLSAAVARMKDTDWERTAENAGIVYDRDGGQLVFTSFGTDVRIYTEDLRVEPALHIWQHLVILQYLEGADGSLPTGDWGSLADLPEGGAVRGASFDREVSSFSARLGEYSPETIERACLLLGGEITENPKTDLSCVFRFMPNYPYRFNLWYADEDFPAGGKMLVDRGVMHQLGTEANGTVASLLAELLLLRCGEI